MSRKGWLWWNSRGTHECFSWPWQLTSTEQIDRYSLVYLLILGVNSGGDFTEYIPHVPGGHRKNVLFFINVLLKMIKCYERYMEKAVVPSRSALSDLGLIADLFENMLLNWSSFGLKSPFFGTDSPKSLIFTFSAFNMKQKKGENFLKNGIFSNKSWFTWCWN